MGGEKAKMWKYLNRGTFGEEKCTVRDALSGVDDVRGLGVDVRISESARNTKRKPKIVVEQKKTDEITKREMKRWYTAGTDSKDDNRDARIASSNPMIFSCYCIHPPFPPIWFN